MSPSASDLALRVERSSDVPLGVQLAWAVRERIATAVLAPGDRLPSVRDLAAEAGINVNTARAVYARLERDGVVRSEQGRGTFVAEAPADDAPLGGDANRSARQELRSRIAALEAELARRPPPATAEAGERARRPAAPRLMSTGELSEVHDQLRDRLRELDAARADVLRRLEVIEEGAAQREDDRRSTVSLRGARVRWHGS